MSTTLSPPRPADVPPAPRRGRRAGAPSTGPAPAWAVLVWTGGLLAIGALSLAAAWSPWPVALVLVAAAVLPLLALRGLVRLGVGPWAAAALLALLLVLLAYVLAADAETSFLQTVRDAVPRLLTSPRPYPVAADLLVAPVLLCGLVSLLVGLRVGSRHRVAPPAGALALYLAGALLTAGRGDPWGVVAALLLVSAVVGWALLDAHRDRLARRIGVVAPVGAVGVGLVAAAAVLPVGTPFEPRSVVDPPVVDVVASSPMPRLGAWAALPDQELMRVEGPEVPLRLVTLDDYDGTTWTAATRYRAFGTGPLDPPLPAGSDQRSVTARVTLAGLGGSWLPAPGRPTAVDDAAVRVDPQTGTLLLPDAPEGYAYEVTAVRDTPPVDALAAARVPATDDIAPYLELPPLPDDLERYALDATAGAVTPYDRAFAIEQRLRTAGRLSPRAISGSQIWRLQTFLFGERGEPGARVGTAEQFATAFALVARRNGLPTRVVVGFAPGTPDPQGPGRIVRGADALAWPEVYFDRLGWVPFSPLPDDAPFQPDVEDEPAVADDSADQTAPPPLPDPDVDGDGSRDRGGAADPSPSPWLLLGLPGLALAGLALARVVRSARHLRRGARGAWAEIVDAARLSGLAPAPHHTADRIAADLDARLGTTAAASVAERAERAAFAPPPASTPLGAERTPAPTAPAATPRDDVRTVTDATLRDDVRAVRRGLRRTVPLWRRWWWPLDPRVFG